MNPPLNRPGLILLPGLLCDAAVWQPQCDALSSAGGADCFVAAYGACDSIEAMAATVLAEAPFGRFALAGHSMGGRVALEMLRQAPDRIERLALLDTGLDPLPGGAAGEAERGKRMALLDTARSAGMRAMGRQWAPGMVHPSRHGTPLFESILDMIERSTPDLFAAQIQALLRRPDARTVFAQAACPVLLGCGRHDAWSPLERHEDMQRLRPASRLVAIEDSGHMVTMEQPAAVTAALQDWLRWQVAGS